MLTVADTPTVKFAIQRRLDAEPGIRNVHVVFRKFPGSHIEIRAEFQLELGEVVSEFHLPDPFEHSHLLDEIDQMAEQVKKARRELSAITIPEQILHAPVVPLSGTGRRGLWKRYGLRT